MADWYFRGGPKQNNLRSCPGCRNLVRTDEEFCPFCARRLREGSGARGLLRRLRRLGDAPEIATRALLGMMIAGFLLQMLADLFLPVQFRTPGGGLLVANMLTYIRLGSNFHLYVAAFDEYWRLLTYCFLHFGVIHILFNSWAFWDLGRLAERLWGARETFSTFILAGIAGGGASYVWNMWVLHAPKNSAGASGAICGILGLLLGAYYRNKHHVGEYLGSQLLRWAVYILVFGLLFNADNAAHIGGMAAGAALGYFLPPARGGKRTDRDERIWNILAVASLALLAVCVMFAAAFFAQGPEFAASLRR